ncbi:DNA-binding SARP family transcriptional activator/tetratricopeptide (TPR) repeat protein [Lipingzhangella halophila]|uniref:DNA-binding SARP family transcriptional activator/tetratricopeptide (TPR) repeat protein n=1 Tax=Lipingzhangella halophila TaxID=1783352 RepID=A0A7W7RPN6_9ACTN|nr:BTAD domain-containing putative transcriptional regulator [Lipingzhangella halophila]MBB4935587.1 DNA-binding SARP family transcriptional activator/tetratricopeptide (TPR) repeat protein [Lipingzhangella halophila]
MEFGVLGPITAWANDEVLPVGGPRQRCVLGVLLVDGGKEVTIERLVDYLWDDDPPRTARSVIQVQISHLRRAFPELIETTAGGYLARVEPSLVDLHRFRGLVGDAKNVSDSADAAVLWERALGCWRGTPFSGIGSDSLWYTVVEPLLEERWAATLAWARSVFSLGRYQEVITRLTPLVREEPSREPFHHLLMAALQRSGQRAAALSVYREMRTYLAEELGVDPNPEIQELHQQILQDNDGGVRGADTLPGPPPREPEPKTENDIATLEGPPEFAPRNDLPRDIPDFTGREQSLWELLHVGQERGSDAARSEIAVITGPGGAGKTTLAVHAAHRLIDIDRFPDGQLFIDLHGYTVDQEPLTAATALGSLLRAVGVDPEAIPESEEERSALWRAMLDSRRVLVVLDNARSFAQVNPLLPAAPGSLTMVTTRNDLPGLSGARYVPLKMFGEKSSLQLFRNALGDERIDVQEEHARRVARLCGGLPLALRIVVGRMVTRPRWTFDHVAQRLSENQRRFRELRVEGQDVEAVFELSYQSLHETQRRTFLLLGMMIGGTVDLHGAAALLDSDPSEIDDPLQELVSVCLLEELEADLFRFHDLIGHFAWQKARQVLPESEIEAARHSLADHYLDVAHKAARWLGPRVHDYDLGILAASRYRNELSSRSQAIAWFERHKDNLASAVDYYASLEIGEQAWQLADSIWRYYESFGYSELLLSTQERALVVSRDQGNDRGSAVTLIGLGIAHCLAGRFETALELLNEARDTLAALGDHEGETRAHGNLGMVYERMGRFREAMAHLEKILDHAVQVGDRRTEALQRGNIATLCQILGDYSRAIEQSEAALRIESEGTAWSHVAAMRVLGEVAVRRGDFDQAFCNLKEALELAEHLGSPSDEIYTRNALAVAQRESGDLENAVESHLAAFERAEETAQRSADAEILYELGTTYARAGRYDEAQASFERALKLAQERKERYAEARALLELAVLPSGLEEPHTTCDRLAAAYATFSEIGVPEAERARTELERRDCRA